MYHQVMDFKISSMDYFNFILRNLPLEKSDSSFKDALHRARGLIKLYVP